MKFASHYWKVKYFAGTEIDFNYLASTEIELHDLVPPKMKESKKTFNW